MKKILSKLIIFSFLSSFVFATDFTPTLHINPSVRQQGFGGFYTTDVDNFYGIYANPATLGTNREHGLFPSIDVNVMGPLSDIGNIISSVSKGDTNGLSEVIRKNNGLNAGLNVLPLISFGKISPMGLGWAFNTQVFMNASIPNVSLSDINLGVESVFRMGFGFKLLNTDHHFLSVGATGKIFAQIACSYTGNVLDFIDSITNNPTSVPAHFSLGYGVDIGAYYSLCNRLDLGFTWHDVFTVAHVSSSTIENIKFKFGKGQILDSKMSTGLAYRFPMEWTNGLVTSFKVMADYNDIMNLFGNQIRNPILDFSCGAEIVFGNFLSIRAGLNEMYPAAGLGLSISNFKLDFAIYGSELGLEPGSTPCLNSSIFIGFTY